MLKLPRPTKGRINHIMKVIFLTHFLTHLANTFMLGKISEPPLPPQQSYKTLVPVSLERKLERLTEITHCHLGSLRRDFGLKVHLL